MIYIENEGALFRGPARAWPKEVWTGAAFEPYKGAMPKDIDWGHEIDEAEAKKLMGAAAPADAPVTRSR
jgi:hypothetical protein